MKNLQQELELLCDSIQKRTLTSDDEYPVDEFEKEICKIFGVKIRDIKSRSREDKFIIPRQLCMWHLRTNVLPRETLSKVGKRYGKRDHATVLNAVKIINNLIETKDKNFYPQIEKFINHINHEKRKTIDSREIER